MRLILVVLFWLLLGLALPGVAVASAKPGLAYVIDGSEHHTPLQPYLLMAEDKSAQASLGAMLAHGQFVPVSDRQLVPGYSRSAFWLRVRLRNPSPYPVIVWLEAGTARLQEVTMFQPGARRWLVSDAGTLLPFDVRPLDTATPVFPVRLAAGEQQDLMWRVASKTSIYIKPKLWQPENFRAAESTRSLLHGLQFGSLSVLALYSMMLFFSLRRLGFAFYSLSIFTYVLYEVSIEGYGFRYLWPEATFLATQIISLSATVSVAFFILVFRDLMSTREKAPYWDRLLLLFLGSLLCAVIVSQWVDYRVGAQLGTLLNLLVTLLMPVLCTVLLWRGVAGGWAFGMSTFASMLGNLPRVLEILGQPVSDVLSTYGAMLGNIMGAGLLLTAFTLQVRRVRLKQEQATASLLALKELQREQLAAQVVIQTRELKHALADAHEANQAKSRLLAHISHDLRAPLSVIIGYTRLLYQPNANSAVYLRAIEDNARHQLSLIDELIDFSSSEMGEIVLRPQEGVWPEFLAALVCDARQLAAAQANDFQLLAGADMPQRLHLDFRRLRQVLVNLLSNAAKYTRHGRIHLSVAARQDDGCCWLDVAVSDNGIGMSAATLARLFQSFERGENARNTEGTGLGLVISARILEKMGARLQVSSTLGKGSTFSFCLPLEIAVMSSLTRVPALSAGPDAVVGCRILLVDDNAQSRALTALWLQGAGYQVLEAVDGYAALSLQAYHPVDAIVSDQQMPACDGWQLLAALRQQAVTTPVLLFSSAFACRPPGLAEDWQFDAYLQKPASAGQLLAALSPLLVRPALAGVPPAWPAQLASLLAEGRISDIENWAQALAADTPAYQAWAWQVHHAAQQLDLLALNQLAVPD